MEPGTAVVTGSSSGLGFATSIELATRGIEVYATVRDDEAAERIRRVAQLRSLPLKPIHLNLEMSNTFPVFVEEIIAETGTIDLLINNAGVLHHGAFEDLSEKSVRDVFEVNTIAPLLLTKNVLPHMRKSRQGRIVMISSLSALAGLAGDVAYAASKHALDGATEALRHEVDRWGISLALVYCGRVDTALFRDLNNADSNSVYAELIRRRLDDFQSSENCAANPDQVAVQIAEIALSEDERFRWATDDISRAILDRAFPAGEAERESFLRSVDGSYDWSQNA